MVVFILANLKTLKLHKMCRTSLHSTLATFLKKLYKGYGQYWKLLWKAKDKKELSDEHAYWHLWQTFTSIIFSLEKNLMDKMLSYLEQNVKLQKNVRTFLNPKHRNLQLLTKGSSSFFMGKKFSCDWKIADKTQII